MRIAFSYLLGAVVGCASPSVASAAVYINSGSVGGAGSYNLSITTDDTVGILGDSNILAYEIFITDGINNYTLTPDNSQKAVFGSDLTATANDLLYNFSSPDISYLLFQATHTPDRSFFCLQANGCFDYDGGGIGIAPTFNAFTGGDYEVARLQGTQIVASVAPVPEPATWAMAILGFGLIGFAMRRRQRLATWVSFAA